MKKLLLNLGLLILLLNSCIAKIVSDKKPYKDGVITVGKTFTFFTKDAKKQDFYISKIDEQNIYGKDEDGKEYVVKKSEIKEIKKFKTLATVGLIVGAVAVGVAGDAFYHNKPIGQ